MITAIVLSAGQARRMGAQKVLLPYGETTVIEHITAAIKAGGADEIIAVTGHEGDRVARALSGSGVRIAYNEDYHGGMLGSVRCGIRAASAGSEAFLIAVGDQPSIRADVVRLLLDTFASMQEGPGTIVVPTYSGKRGHPVIFSSCFRQEVLTRFDDVGLRGLLHAHPDAVREVPMETSGILRDMNVPEDYKKELDELAKLRSDVTERGIHESS